MVKPAPTGITLNLPDTRGGFIDIVDVNQVKPAPTGITLNLPDTRGRFIDIVDVHHRFLVKPHILHHSQEQARCLFHKNDIFLWGGHLARPEKLSDNGARCQLNSGCK